MTETSKAIVFTGPGEPLVVREFPLPRLASGELLVKVTCCTLCGSDLHSHNGRRSVPCPTILGHEILGTVAQFPPGENCHDYHGRSLQVGDRVTWSVAASCGACFFCQHGLPQKCERLLKYGHERLDDEHPLSGGLAEHCHLAAGTAVLTVPGELPDEVACPVNCATATVAAALRAAGDCRDLVILVQGAGALGLTASAMAHSRGAREIIVCDVDGRRLDLARRFGATQTVDVAAESNQLAEVVRRCTDGRGVDVALEMSGSTEAFRQGIDLLRIGGRYALVGAVFPGTPAQLAVETLVRKLLTIRGVHNYTPEDLAAALEFLVMPEGTYPLGELVSGRFPLEEAEAAFRYAHKSGAFRIAILP